MKKNRILFALFFLFISTKSFADDWFEKKEWRIGLEGDLGLALHSTSVQGETSKSGFGLAGKALVAYVYHRWAFELGLGMNYTSIAGTRESDGIRFTSTANALMIDLGVRYEFAKYWSFAPVLAIAMGEDLSFQEAANPSLPTQPLQSTLLLGGMKVMYDLTAKENLMPNYHVMIGAKYLTDLNISNRQIHFILGLVQIEWPFWRYNREVETAEKDKPAETKTVEWKKQESIPPKEKSVEVNIGAIFFRSGTAQLNSKSKKYLKELAKKLSEMDTWESVQVEGHTDSRGSEVVNQKLSEARAHTVADILRENIDKSRIKEVGFGSRVPLDSGGNGYEADSRNRRVNFRFYGVNDPSPIEKQIHTLQKKYRPSK